MISYKNIIKDDTFDVKNKYFVETNLPKLCWSCETKHNAGYMVWDSTKLRRIFFCEECVKKL